MERSKCIVCDNKNLDSLFTLNMPSFMGITDSPESDRKLDEMIFTSCQGCGNVQLKNLLPPEIIYQNNHNIGVVGTIWKEHYDEFSDFIKPKVIGKTILEISDPSAKIASKISNITNKWYIVEPNPNIKSFSNIIFINKFFDNIFSIDDKVDTIINSHFFEHTYEPNKFLSKCNELLADGGDMFFSIPNLEYLLNSEVSPNGILHFEHTFFYDTNKLEVLLNKNGFKILSTAEYKKHSLFFHVVKSDKSNVDILNYQPGIKFLKNLNIHKNRISEINEIISNKETVYIYGSHITSQFYIFNGLEISKIKGVLDNSKSKQNKYLFGTNLKVFNPNIIDNYKEVAILCSHMGIYFKEIEAQLMAINKNVKIL